MAQVFQRVWKSGPRNVRRTAWGYTLQVNGRQIRKFDAAWDEDAAQKALAARILERDVPAAPTTSSGMTFGPMVEKFIAEKKSEGKRSIKDDEERSVPLLAFFGKETPLGSITTRR